MNNYLLTKDQCEDYKADGFGKSKNNDGSGCIKMFIHIRKDSMIPSFDALTDLKYLSKNMEDQVALTASLIEMVTDGGGMFIEDILKLQERDIYSMAGESLELGEVRPVVALHALKKAICNYFKETDQDERYRKATETVICSCRHVTDSDIEDLIQNGKTSYDEISSITGAGTGCGSCKNNVKEFIEKKVKTGLGNI
ncbi:hypothetical protein HN709_03590 [Candidatus Peregrinibacteria bacterium]|nr:hypothetical protein [Candidatus Peregrinibacteria bacterium]